MRPDKSGEKDVPHAKCPVVAIGASAGGLEAFKQFLAVLPIRFGFAVVLLQHLSPTRKRLLPELCRSLRTDLDIVEISDNLEIQACRVYVAQPGQRVHVREGVFKLSPVRENEDARLLFDEFLIDLASFPRLNPDPVLEADDSGRIIYSNPGSEAILESLGLAKGAIDFFLPSDLEDLLKDWDKKSSPVFNREIVIGSKVFAETVHFVPEMKVVRIYAHDITERSQASEALLESEERLKRSQELAHLGSWELDVVNDTLAWSDEVYRIFGLKPQEFGASYEAFLEAVHPDDRAAVDEAYSGSIREGRDTYEIEHRLVRRGTGEIRYVHEKCENIRDKNDRIIRSVGMVHDITERRKAEEALRESEAKYRELFENMTSGFAFHKLIADKTGKPIDYVFLEMNAAFERLTGLKKRDILGKPATKAIPGIEHDPADWIGKYGKVALTGKAIQLEQHFEGVDKWFSVSAYCPMKGYFATIFEDITKRKRAEDELAHARDLAEERARDLEAAIKDLEGFTYSVSHDLRAPIRHISGFTDLLRKLCWSALDEKGKQYLETISSSSRKLGMLMDELLEFSRMGRSPFQKGPVDLATLIREVVESFSQETENRRIEWMIGNLPTIEGDSSMLRLVLVNLVSNALKFTRKKEEARIEIGHRDEGNAQVMYVKDNGAGFDMRYADKLFGIFQRLHQEADFEGTGIGLANVARIIHRHGGQVRAEGAVDQGAVFSFVLPKNLPR